MLSSNTSAVSGDTVYIEDVFSTYLYTGNGSASGQTITNGIDLSTKGGLVWQKNRGSAIKHWLYDTAQPGALVTNATDAAYTANTDVTFSTTGFVTKYLSGNVNLNGANYASWTFRKQPKFFDIVTYTGNGTSQNIAHSLGSVPGCIIVKRTDAVKWWAVQHRSVSASQVLELDATSAAVTDNAFNSAYPTSTTFSVAGIDQNASGGTYVAYIFAHDAGGFGLTGTDNVISCGSFDAASVTTTTLGYEPQFLMFKRTDTTGNWRIVDNMRGWPNSGNPQELNPNLSAAETSNGGVNLIATGFTNVLGTGTYIYIAIRRGPMKVPTDGTKVFQPYAYAGNSATRLLPTGITEDMAMVKVRNEGTSDTNLVDRLRGPAYLKTDTTAAEAGSAGTTLFPTTTWNAAQTGITIGSQSQVNDSLYNYVSWNFRRAPSFFDEVCYTGTGTSALQVNHNLGVVPELVITKVRNTADSWNVRLPAIKSTTPNSLLLNATSGWQTGISATDTSTTFTVSNGTAASSNDGGFTYVAYLFATCAGVSKIGSYTGTGTTKQVDCGFAAGARFVLIKRTDSTGDWYVWDTARGIVSGNDPYLLLNSTAAEVTTTDYIDTYSAGFELSSTAPAALNASGGTYIFLAIA